MILDRNEIFGIHNYWFSEIGHVTPEDMEMSEITLRIECKHFRFPGGPASGRNCPLKSRNLVFGHPGIFFQSLGIFEKWENRKNVLAMQSKLFRSGRNRSEVNRWAGGRAILRKRSSPARKARVCSISFAGYPIFDLAIFGL